MLVTRRERSSFNVLNTNVCTQHTHARTRTVRNHQQSIVSLPSEIVCQSGQTARAKKYIVHTELSEYYNTNRPATLLIICLLQTISYILLLPIHTVLNILSAIIIKNFFFSWAILTLFSLVASTAVYTVCKQGYYNFILNRIKNNQFYEVLKKESTENPYKTAYLARLVMLPAGMQEYLLAMIGNPYSSFISSAFFVHGIHILETVLIAQGFDNMKEFLTDRRSWIRKSVSEKISFFMVFGFIIITIGIMVITAIWATRKINKKKKEIKSMMSV